MIASQSKQIDGEPSTGCGWAFGLKYKPFRVEEQKERKKKRSKLLIRFYTFGSIPGAHVSGVAEGGIRIRADSPCGGRRLSTRVISVVSPE